jgi:formate dehydrogenase major subunit
LETYGSILVKAVPDKEGRVNKGLLCGRGRFGFDCAASAGRLLEPLIRNGNGELEEADYHDALVMAAKKAQAVAARRGRNAVAVAVSGRYTNEEAYAVKKLADVMGARVLSFDNRASGIAPVLGFDASPNTIDELLSTEVILAVGFDWEDNPVIRLKLKQAAEAGAKLILINPAGLGAAQQFSFAEKIVRTDNDLTFLRGLAKAILDGGAVKAEGLDAFAADLASVKPDAEAAAVAALYTGAKKAMIVFQQNVATTETASLLADIAVISGHIGAPRNGILQVKAKNNSQGLVDLGIRAGAEAMDGVKALLCFGEDPQIDLSDLEFLMVCDTHLTKTAAGADVVIPGTGFASTDGTFTNTERRLQRVQMAVPEDAELSNWEVAAEIARVYETDFPWEDTADISEEMEDDLPRYRYAEPGEIYGGVLVPDAPRLLPVSAGEFTRKQPISDHLMNTIDARLPKAAIL